MRRVIALIVLTLLIGVVACHGKGRRNLRPDDKQIYDLPPKEAAWTSQPPDYPKEEITIGQNKSKDGSQMPKSMGPNGAGMGSGSPGSPGGGPR